MTGRAAILLISLFLAAGAGAAGIGAWRWGAAEDAARRDALETSRVRGWARANTAAGVSVLPKRVPAANVAELRRLEPLPGFHDYAMRCSSCHVLPDPGAYPAARWRGKAHEMRQHADRAGLMPAPAHEIDNAVRFLEAASDSLRERRDRD